MNDTRDETSRFLRTELLERIAHELRGPAGVTLGALDELEHALDPSLVAENRVLFAMARRGAKRVLRTAERLTRTAQLEGATAQVSLLPCDLRAVLKQAVQDAELVEARSSIRVGLTLPEGPTGVEADSGWLSVVLAELVSQAIRSSRRAVDVTIEREAGAVLVRVQDDRGVIMDAPSTRFVPIKDRRDAALGWPMICDVARAHGADPDSEPMLDAQGTVTGLAVSLRLRSATL